MAEFGIAHQDIQALILGYVDDVVDQYSIQVWPSTFRFAIPLSRTYMISHPYVEDS